jgi:hypothetical protein
MLYAMQKAAGDYRPGDLVAAIGAEVPSGKGRVRRVFQPRIDAWLDTRHIAPVLEKPAPAAKPTVDKEEPADG